MRKHILLLLFTVLWGINGFQGYSKPNIQGDAITDISNHFKTGNTKGLSKYLSSSVNLSLMNNEYVYSKAQSEIILSKFFKENHPQSSSIIHRLENKSNFQHAVMLLNTSKGDYRVAISLKSDKQLELIEIRIERSN